MTTTQPAPIECTTIAQFHAIATRARRPGGVTCVEVRHDAWCSRVECTCNPDLLLLDLTSEPPVLLARFIAPTHAGGRA
jgi:hypothetical protein